MKSFIVSLDVSALEKYKSESEPYNLLVDTGKLKTVQDFISWFQNLFSIRDPVVLLNDKNQVNVRENVNVLCCKNTLIVKPSTSVSNSDMKLPILNEEPKGSVASSVAKENDVKSIPPAAPAKNKKKDQCPSQKAEENKKKTNNESDVKKKRDRFVYIWHYIYENGKLTEKMKDINIENSSSYPNIESDDMLLYRCYSKNINNLRRNVSQSVPQTESSSLNNAKFDFAGITDKQLNKTQNITNKQTGKNAKPQNCVPKAKDANQKNKSKEP